MYLVLFGKGAKIRKNNIYNLKDNLKIHFIPLQLILTSFSFDF